MPLYVFCCPVCFRCIEILQSYRDPPPRCPDPSHPNERISMERTFSQFAVRATDPPRIQHSRSKEGFRITTTDARPRKERE
jgi:hypothetical protein